MSSGTLRDRLDERRRESAAEIDELRLLLQTKQAERDNVHTQILELQKRLQDLTDECDRLQVRLDERIESQVRSQLEAVTSLLQESYESVLSVNKYRQTRTELQQQRKALLESDQDLEAALEDYRSFEEQFGGQLDDVPASYREALQERHAELRRQLEPYFELTAELEGLQYDERIRIYLTVASHPDEDEICWVLPLPADAAAFPPEHAIAMGSVGEILVNALWEFSKQDDWYFVALDTESWAGYLAVHALVEYEGEESIADVTQQLLSEKLRNEDVFKGVTIELQAAEIPYTVWVEGYKEDAESDEPSTDEGAVVEETRFREGAAQGWYSDEDIVSWERPLNVAEGSLWNEQARRLRTMLIRMIAKGKTGGQTVAPTQLWQPLPESHAENLRRGVEQLLDNQVLIGSQVEANEVAVNPEMLTEVQNLIGYDVTPFWQDIVLEEREVQK